MQYSFRNITALSLALMVWTSTIGLNLHLLYCFCKEEWKVSLFELEDSCTKAMQRTMDQCCKSHDGCAAKGNFAEIQKSPCQSSSVEYVKIDDKFIPGKSFSSLLFKSFFAPDALIPAPSYPDLNHCYQSTELNKAPPLLHYGRLLLTFIQIMIC